MKMFEADHSKGKGNGGGGGLWGSGWKAANLLRAFYLMIMSLIILLAWENTRPLTSYDRITHRSSVADSQHQFHFGSLTSEGMTARALWASAEKFDISGERALALTEHRTVTRVGDGDEYLDPPHEDGTRSLSGVRSRAVVLDDRIMTRGEQAPEPLPSALNLRISLKNPSEAQLDDAVEPGRLPKLLISENSPTARNDAPAAVVRTENVEKQVVALEGTGSKTQVCDFAKGQWVKDEAKRPLYSGKMCKAYLPEGFACREMNRPNYDYENLRWQPEGCNLPPFTGDGFLQRLRNKVVAFVGDSLGRQQFQSLMCMITEGKDDREVDEVHMAWGHGVKWAYRFRTTNTTILFQWSASLCEIEGGNPNENDGYSAMHLDRPDAFLKNSLHKLDLVVLNSGHHWNRGKLQSNKWQPYVDGKPVTDRKLAGMAEAYNFTVHKVIQWIDGKLDAKSPKRQHPTVFLRTMSPRHFSNGDWNTGGTCDSTSSQYEPRGKKDEQYSNVVVPAARVYRGPITEQVAENAVKGTRVNLLNITHLSNFREEGHISKYGKGKDAQHQDCLHWCLPGVPDVWNELLFGNLVSDPNFSPL